jgi:hypothetical protein
LDFNPNNCCACGDPDTWPVVNSYCNPNSTTNANTKRDPSAYGDANASTEADSVGNSVADCGAHSCAGKHFWDHF